MPDVTFKIVGLDKAVGETRAAAFAGIDAGLRLAGARAEELVVENIVEAKAVAFGILAGSVKALDPVKIVDISRVEIVAVPPGDVYVDPVEMGTKPHFPPPSALVPWVKKKFHVGDGKKALSIAWAIAKSIAKRGTRAVRMFTNAQAKLEGELQGIFERAIGAEFLKRVVGK